VPLVLAAVGVEHDHAAVAVAVDDVDLVGDGLRKIFVGCQKFATSLLPLCTPCFPIWRRNLPSR
jgi:hypothetical protein